MLTKVRTSLSFGSTRQEKVERMKVSDVVRSVLQRRSSHSEQVRMMAFLKREFPLSFERFLRDHGGAVPHIPLQVPVNHVITRGDMESKEDGPDVLIETEAAVSTLMCSMPTMSTQRNFDTNPEEVETAVASDVWALVTGAFCLSTPPQYLPQDDQRTESDNQTNEKAIPKSHSLLQHSESVYRKLNPLNMLNPGILSPGTPTTSSIRNPLVFQQRPGVDYRTQRDLLFEDLASESQRIMKLYCGITRERGTTFNWILKKAQDDINVHNCDLPGSSFSALKSDCFVKKDKYTILKYLTDDDRSKEYDETLDGYKVMLHVIYVDEFSISHPTLPFRLYNLFSHLYAFITAIGSG